MTQKPFLGGGVARTPGFGPLSEKKIAEMRRREVLEKTRTQQKQMEGMDFTFDPKTGFAVKGEDRKQDWRAQPEIGAAITKAQREALHLGPEPLDPVKVEGIREIPRGPISPLGLFSIEAETMSVIAQERPYVFDLEPANVIFNAYKLGLDLGFISRPKGSTVTSVKSLNPFSSDFDVKGIHENLHRIKEGQEERSFREQIQMGAAVPTNFIPVNIGTKTAHGTIKQTLSIASHLKANSNKEVFKAIVEKVPQILEETPDLATAYRRGGDELLVQIMNKPLNIKGIPENSLFEADLRLWLDMRTTPMNLDAFGDELIGAVS